MSGTIQKNDIITQDALNVFKEIVTQFQNILDEAKKLKSELGGSGFKETTTQAKKAKAALTEVEKAQKLLITTQKKLKVETSALGKELAEEKVKLTEARKANRLLAQEKAGLTKTTTGLKGAFNGMIKSLGVYSAAIFGLNRLVRFFTNDLLNMTKKLDSLHFSMKTVITDTKEYTVTTKFLARTAINYGQDLLTLTERYIKFRAAAMQSNMTATETMKIFDSTAKAAAVLGLKTDEVNGVFLALEQMISKGKVTTEELRRQLGERLPGAFGIMADAIGVSIIELDKMLKAGEVLSTDALPKFADALEAAYGIEAVEKVDTLAAAQGRLKTSWVQFVDELEASRTYISVLNTLNDVMGDLRNTIGNMTDLQKVTAQSGEVGEAVRKARKELDKMPDVGTSKFKDLTTYQDKWIQSIKDTGMPLSRMKRLFQEYVEERQKEVTLSEKSKGFSPFSAGDFGKELDQLKKDTESYGNASDTVLKGLIVDSNSFMTSEVTGYKEILLLQDKKLANDMKINAAIVQQYEDLQTRRDLTKEEQELYEKYSLEYIQFSEARIGIANRLASDQKKSSKATKEQSFEQKKILNSELDSYKAAYLKQLHYARKNAEDVINIKRLEIINRLNDEDEMNALTLTQRQQLINELGLLTDEAIDIDKEKRISSILDSANEEKVAIAQRYKAEFEASRGTQRDKIAATGKTTIKLLQLEYDTANKIQELYAEDTEEWKKQQDIKANLEVALAAESIDITRKMNKQKLEDTVATMEAIQDVANAGFEFGAALNDRAVAYNERRYELETQAAGDNTFKKLVAERKYEKEAAKLKRKQAIADKAQAANGIILNTALAVIKAFSTAGPIGGIPLAAIVSAIGTIQLATVLAQPIPQFAEGVENFGGGLAVVGDKKGDKSLTKSGGSELAILPSGKSILTPSSPTLMDLPSGTDIIPHDETQRILANQAMTQTYNIVDMSGTNSHLKRIDKNTSESVTFQNGYKIIKRKGYTGRCKI